MVKLVLCKSFLLACISDIQWGFHCGTFIHHITCSGHIYSFITFLLSLLLLPVLNQFLFPCQDFFPLSPHPHHCLFLCGSVSLIRVAYRSVSEGLFTGARLPHQWSYQWGHHLFLFRRTQIDSLGKGWGSMTPSLLSNRMRMQPSKATALLSTKNHPITPFPSSSYYSLLPPYWRHSVPRALNGMIQISHLGLSFQ